MLFPVASVSVRKIKEQGLEGLKFEFAADILPAEAGVGENTSAGQLCPRRVYWKISRGVLFPDK